MILWTKHWEYFTRQIHYNGIMDQTLGKTKLILNKNLKRLKLFVDKLGIVRVPNYYVFLMKLSLEHTKLISH